MQLYNYYKEKYPSAITKEFRLQDFNFSLGHNPLRTKLQISIKPDKDTIEKIIRNLTLIYPPEQAQNLASKIGGEFSSKVFSLPHALPHAHDTTERINISLKKEDEPPEESPGDFSRSSRSDSVDSTKEGKSRERMPSSSFKVDSDNEDEEKTSSNKNNRE